MSNTSSMSQLVSKTKIFNEKETNNTKIQQNIDNKLNIYYDLFQKIESINDKDGLKIINHNNYLIYPLIKNKNGHYINNGTIKNKEYGCIENELNLFHLCAIFNKIDMLNYLLKKTNINLIKKSRNNATALMLASKYGNIEIVTLLIDRLNSDRLLIEQIDISDDNLLTALMYASREGHMEIVELLINNGAKIDIQVYLQTKSGNQKKTCNKTALMFASQKGHTEIVELLINKGANIYLKNSNDTTALMYAIQFKHIEIVKLLIKPIEVIKGYIYGKYPVNNKKKNYINEALDFINNELSDFIKKNDTGNINYKNQIIKLLKEKVVK